jgi:dsRNA-specific ribonuclease
MGDKAKKKKGDVVVTDPRQLICRPGYIDLQEKPYETLELLGDSIFHYGLTKYLFLRFPQQDEGFITRLRAKIEKGDSMAKIARKMGLGQWILISKQTEADGGREDDKILEDVFEALMGAMVMVCGPEVCTEIAFKICDRDIDIPTLLQKDDNYKDQLLRYYHRMGWSPDPQYKCIQEDDKSFTAWVVGKRDQKLAFGNGRSKPEATQLAARRMLEKCNMIGARGEALMNIRDLDALVQPSNLPLPATPESFIIGEKSTRTVPRSSARGSRQGGDDDSDSNSDAYPSRKSVAAGHGHLADARRHQAPVEDTTDSDSDIDSDSSSVASSDSSDSSTTSDSDAAEIREARGIRKVNRGRRGNRSSSSDSSSSDDSASSDSSSSASDTAQARRNVRKRLPVKRAVQRKSESDSSNTDDSSSSDSDSSSGTSSPSSSSNDDDVPSRRGRRASVRREASSIVAKLQRKERNKKKQTTENSESSMSSGSD